MRRRATLLLAVFVLLIGACGGDDDVTAENGDPVQTAAPAEPTATALPPAPTAEPAATATPERRPEPPGIRQRLADAGAAPITLSSADQGPHPVLVWDAVDGAAEYWLVVLGPDGGAYWTWSGVETTARFGGGANADLNQTAVLFEPMTATVAAIGADGTFLAMSDPTELVP